VSRRRGIFGWCAACALAAVACSPPPPRPTFSSTTTIDDMRAVARSSEDGEVVGRWLLEEMLAPGGAVAQAEAARRRLDAVRHDGVWASFARAVFDDEHGRPEPAAEGYVSALRASSVTDDARAPLVAWYAVRHLMALRGAVSRLFARYRPTFDALLHTPRSIGWRAVADLEEWRAVEAYAAAPRAGSGYDEELARQMGCARGLRAAGPFGHGAATDAAQSFAPESASPWPPAWPPDPVRGSVPHELSVVQNRCLALVDEQVEDGVFYVETFFDTRGDRELLVAVQGAVAIWVDGTLVSTRASREWGSWQRFGVHVGVADGRHRVLAKTIAPGGSIRLLNPDGTAAELEADGDERSGFAVTPPVVLSDPNPIDDMVRALSRGEEPPPTLLPIDRALAAYAASVDQIDDVASAFMGPLVELPNAAAVSLEMAAPFAGADPAWPQDARASRARSLRDRALTRDPGLWRPRLAAILDGAAERGLSDTVDPLRKLVEDVPSEPDGLEHLAQVYGRLGWRDAQMGALQDLVHRFPDDAGALRAYLEVLDENGPAAEADKVADRLGELEPDSEVDLDRDLARHDYDGALRQLRAIQKRRPDRNDIVNRLADVLARSGKIRDAAAQLEAVLAKHPRDAQARFRLADRALAQGDPAALRRALAAALQVSGSPDELRAAIDLVEGATDLEPYRQDGRAVISDFQAWERGGHRMDGTAARVLDYSALWVHDDGSSEMLEHEIQKIQSQEAVHSESEAEPPGGLVLHLRVIKPDGRVLEPEPVSGKATLTLPHLEVGDFVEIEHITSQPGDGARGRQYRSPQWFFREADKGYWRSEFVVITPSDRKLEIEARGNVPPPRTRDMGAFVERRWRVDLSPPAELEADGPPISEFLPSVRVGWGVSLETTLARLVDVVSDETPLDPRLLSTALDIVRGTPTAATDERARRLYRWVVENVRDGKETDGRRVLTGRSGVRQAAFRYLLRLVRIDCELSLVKNRLAIPPLGELSEVEQYDGLVMRLTTEHGLRWLTVRDKFAPYGYVPAEWRDQPAVRLVAGTPRDILRAQGEVDGVVYEGAADVHEDGSATLDLTLTFKGDRAILWRTAIDQIPESKVTDFVERELVAPSFDGGHVRDVHVEHAKELDVPLVMHVRIDAPELAKPTPTGLSLHPPFAPHLAQLAALPERRTALLRRSSWRAEVRVRVTLPPSSRIPSPLPNGRRADGDALVAVTDASDGRSIEFNRVIEIPSGRVQPGDDYIAWQKFVQTSDALLTRDVVVPK